MRLRVPRRLPRFGLRSLLLATTVAAIAAALWAHRERPTLGPHVGTVRMDNPLTIGDKTWVAHTTCFQAPVIAAPLSAPYVCEAMGNQVVVVVDDLDTISGTTARQIGSHPDVAEARPTVHFVELQAPGSAKIRSFDGRWGWELPESLEGALTAVMVLDQLAFRLPRGQRVALGRTGEPTEITFSSGSALKVCYTNDWGHFYLREVQGPDRHVERLVMAPYKQHELDRAASLAAARESAGD